MNELFEQIRITDLDACIEAHLPDNGWPFQTGLAISPCCRRCPQAMAAAVRPARTRSRTARPDTQSVEVSWQMKSHPGFQNSADLPPHLSKVMVFENGQ